MSGFDRLVFRGTLLPLMPDHAMFHFLTRAGVRLLDFKDYVSQTSERVKAAALSEAEKQKRPVLYLESPKTSKEDLAKQLLAEHPLNKPGLVCAFKAVEPCMSFEYHRSPDPKERGLKLRPRKCLHVYKYLVHPSFGFMNARIQTWFPFNVQVCLNGREWLARQLRRRHSGFLSADNCFPALANPVLAQRLMGEQLETDWPAALTMIARALNPLHDEIFQTSPMDYYWSAYQTEWATDIVFKTPAALAEVYPALVQHAMHHFKSPDVMRFLGKKAHGNFTGELTTSFKNRPEGVRVKHWAHGNSVKMYDKAVASYVSKPPLRRPPTSRCYAHRTTTRTVCLLGDRCARVSRISTAAPKYPSAPTSATSKPSPSWRTSPPAHDCSTPSLDPSWTMAAASAHCASATRSTLHSSKPSPAVSSSPLAFATVTSDSFSIPPLTRSHQRSSDVSQPRSAVSFASSGRTESSRRSPRRTATNSPNAAVS